jgi:hypothetical protein
MCLYKDRKRGPRTTIGSHAFSWSAGIDRAKIRHFQAYRAMGLGSFRPAIVAMPRRFLGPFRNAGRSPWPEMQALFARARPSGAGSLACLLHQADGMAILTATALIQLGLQKDRPLSRTLALSLTSFPLIGLLALPGSLDPQLRHGRPPGTGARRSMPRRDRHCMRMNLPPCTAEAVITRSA